MSIATQIENLTAKVSTLSDVHDDIITAINSKGVSATGHGFEDFADDIEAIDQSGTHNPVIAVADTGVISASCGGVTNTHTLSSSDDADFVAGNIKLGVTVFGVTGTHQGAGTYESKTVTPNAAGQTVYPDSGYDALSSVVINGDADLVAGNIKKDVDVFGVVGTFEGGSLESKTVTPSASTQTVTPSSGNYGLSSVTVNGDANLIAGNIKKDVQIFGVTGTYETSEEKDLYAQSDTGIQTGDLLVYSDLLVPANVKKNITIFGVTGTYEGFDGSAGSLIVCTCSSNITSVTATYGSTTVTCYMTSNVAYVNIPYSYTGNVSLVGSYVYYDPDTLATENRTAGATVSITTIKEYDCSISTSTVVYDAGTWYGVDSYEFKTISPSGYSTGSSPARYYTTGAKLTFTESASSLDFSGKAYSDSWGGTKSYGYIYRIHRRGYNKIKYTGTYSADSGYYIGTQDASVTPYSISGSAYNFHYRSGSFGDEIILPEADYIDITVELQWGGDSSTNATLSITKIEFV